MAEKDQVEVRFTVDADFIKDLQDKLGQQKTTDVARTALTILKWATDEYKQGRVILSASADGSDLHRLTVAGVPLLSPKVS